MCKMSVKLVLLTLVVLMVGNCSAAISWVGNSANPDNLWSTAVNWSTGVPTAADDIYIEASWNQGKQPLIQTGINGVGGTMRMGSTNDTKSSLTITGGSLTLSSHFILGQGSNSVVSILMSGGTLTASSLWSGNMQSWNMAKQGTLYMTGGTVNLISEGLYVSRCGGNSGLGVQLDGGVINAASIYFGAAGMDITGGKLVLPSAFQGRVQSYIDQSWLTGYGSKDKVVITPVGNNIEVTAVVPEPVTMVLMGLGSLLVVRKRS